MTASSKQRRPEQRRDRVIPVHQTTCTSFKLTQDQILYALAKTYGMPVHPAPKGIRLVYPATVGQPWTLTFDTEEDSTCEGDS